MLPPVVSFYDARCVVVRCVDVFWFVYCRLGLWECHCWGREVLGFSCSCDAQNQVLAVVAQVSELIFRIENQ
jgi:hypothetical protein